MMMDLATLKRCPLAELEALYAEPGPAEIPRGRFRGAHLLRLDEPRHRRPGYLGSAPFQRVPFGLDFDEACWFFLHPRLRAGRFVVVPGPSRWRPTHTLGLHYHPSKLPFFIRRWLYDEVKPLSDRLLLGLGGVDADRGRGDHFFFALTRHDP